MPILQPLIVLVMLVITIGSTTLSFEPEASLATQAEIKCLADNIYHEARGEPLKGQLMVGQTVINRAKDSRWKPTVCGVVYQPKQFSWTIEKPHPSITNKEAYKSIYKLSKMLIKDKDHLDPSGVNHYLRCDWRDKVSWWKGMEFVGQVGDHCFYKG